MRTFKKALSIMEHASCGGNVDDFVLGANLITEKLGGTAQFSSKAQFDHLMQNPESFKL